MFRFHGLDREVGKERGRGGERIGERKEKWISIVLLESEQRRYSARITHFKGLVEMQWSDNNRHSHSLFLLVNAEFGGYSYEDLV